MGTKKYKRKDSASSSSEYVYVNLSAIDAIYENGRDSILLMRSGTQITVQERASSIERDLNSIHK